MWKAICVPKNVKTLFNAHVEPSFYTKLLLYALKTNAPFLWQNQPNNIKKNFKMCVKCHPEQAFLLWNKGNE